ncbi:hypothetical protein [Nocardioides bigeumensis]|uniref:Tetratricopeptide repeat protein n=1 Tax=Nocardioides bigeumensis TaxID=433657 RepID=A0ABN2YQ90_9ACTN
MELADQAVELAPDSFLARVALTSALTSAHRYAEAAASASVEVGALDRPWWAGHHPLFRRDYLSGAYAVEEYPPLLVWDASGQEFGGASVGDSAFVPTSRYEPPDVECRGATLLRALLLAGEPDEVLARIEGGTRPDDDGLGRSCATTGYLSPEIDATYYRAAAHLLADAPSEAEDVLAEAAALDDDGFGILTLTDVRERLQDLLRSGGDLETARTQDEAWTQAQPEDGKAWQRLGEVAFLDQRWPDAVAAFEQAVTHLTEAADVFDPDAYQDAITITPSEDVAWAQLQLGAAQRETGESGENAFVAALDRLAAASPDQTSAYALFIRVHALGQLGESALQQEDWELAAERFGEAIDVGDDTRGSRYWLPTGSDDLQEAEVEGGILRGAQHNNLALALARLDQPRRAETAARAALERDPANPVFRDTLGFVLQKSGRDEEAEAAYDDSVEADATSYVSTANRAVLTAQRGQRQAAIEDLLGVLAEHPDYALGWHNLGVLWGESWRPMDAIRAQGALAKAADLDRDLRGSDAVLVMDERIYESGLDVDKVAAGDWQYGRSATATSQRLTWSMVVLLLLRVVWLLGLDRVTGAFVERALGARDRFPLVHSWWGGRWYAAWGLTLSVVVIAGAALLDISSLPDVWLVLSMAGLVVLPVIVRALIGRRAGYRVRHTAWPPAVLIGCAVAFAGVSFAPFPVLDTEGGAPPVAVRWAAPVAAGALSVLSVTAVVMTDLPLLRAVAAGGLVLLASMLTPVGPLDGAALRGRVAQAGLTIGLALGTLGLALNWL